MEANDFLKMICDMKHSLGLDLTKLRKGQTKVNAYRNYYWGKNEYLEQAACFGFIKKSYYDNDILYTVTDSGLDFLSKLFDIKIIYW